MTDSFNTRVALGSTLASMTKTTKPIPDGYTSLTPFLVVEDGARAIDYYRDAFGATRVRGTVDVRHR